MISIDRSFCFFEENTGGERESLTTGNVSFSYYWVLPKTSPQRIVILHAIQFLSSSYNVFSCFVLLLCDDNDMTIFI